MEQGNARLKILVAIASYGTSNDRYLARLIEEYRSMSYTVDIVILSNILKPVSSGVELVVGLPAKDPWSLPFGHKRLFADRCEDYDLFIYSEDDTLITENNITSFLRMVDILEPNEIPGFMRYERSESGELRLADVHGHFHWDPRSVRTRGGQVFAFFTCEHSACYVLTRQQLKRAIASGNFLVGPHEGKYDLLCSAATDPYTQCGFTKLICISKIEDFLVHHLSNRYIGTTYGLGEREFHRQLAALFRISENEEVVVSLFNTETRLAEAEYSKNYYEPLRPDIEAMIPGHVRTILSLGCGWGAMELGLAKRGLHVSAVALDPVICMDELRQTAEVISSDLGTAFSTLEGRKFDCVLLLNILHLIPDPQSLLLSLRRHLSSGSVAIALVPNMREIGPWIRRRRPYSSLNERTDYSRFLVNFSSKRTVRRWFHRAGMEVCQTVNVLRPRAQALARLTFGFGSSVLTSEFFAVAKAR